MLPFGERVHPKGGTAVLRKAHWKVGVEHLHYPVDDSGRFYEGATKVRPLVGGGGLTSAASLEGEFPLDGVMLNGEVAKRSESRTSRATKDMSFPHPKCSSAPLEVLL